MAVTVRGTDILFNDGTTQSTAASAVPSPSAGTLVASSLYPSSSTGSTSYVLLSPGYSFLVAGTVRTRMRVRSGYIDYGARSNGYGRIFINGSAVGTELVCPSGVSGYYYLEQDFSVAAGDFIQFGIRSSSSGITMGGSMFLMISNRRSAATISALPSSNPF